jgi:hypothetical protein
MYAEATKACTGSLCCGKQRPLSEFSVIKKTGKHAAWCRACHAHYSRERYKNDPEYYERKRLKRKELSEDPIASEARRQSKLKENVDPEVWELQVLKQRARRYDLTLDELEGFLAVPVCQSCGEPLNEDPSLTHIDHCHDTDSVRGIVCGKCNLSMHGSHEVCIERLLKCVDYLIRHSDWRLIERL